MKSLKLSIILLLSSTYITSSAHVTFYENTNIEHQLNLSGNTRNLVELHENEICSKVDDDEDLYTSIDISLGSINVDQENCVQFFKVTIDDEDLLDKYLHFEINLENPHQYLKTKPILLMNNSQPYAYFSDEGDIFTNAKARDENGYVNRKEYHHIVIAPEKISMGDTFYFAFYKMFANKNDYVEYTLSYDVSVTSSKDKPCPQNCNNKGVCNKGVCDCVTGVFDLDCSVEAHLVNFGEKTSTAISSYTWEYFYFSITGFDTNINVKFTKTKGDMQVSFIFNKNKEFNLPSDTDPNQIVELDDELRSKDFRISDQTLKIHLGENLVIGAFNRDKSKIDFDIELEFSESETLTRTTIMYVMIGISTVLIILWGIITVIKYKVHRESEALLALQQNNQRESSDCLSAEEYDKHFPKTPYKELKSSFEQTTCSICLEEFNPDTLCRQIYCEHIYHDTCVDSWLVSHPDCPNCKKKVTKTAIEEFKNSKNGIQSAPAGQGSNGVNFERDDAPLIQPEECKARDDGDNLQQDKKNLDRNGENIQEESKEEINSLREDEFMDDVIIEFKDEPNRNVTEINQNRAQKTLAEVKGLGIIQTNSEQV